MQYRLGQVVYTLTQFSTVKSVVFQIEGQTVTVFGSEGIALDGPVGRADFTAQLPSMFVDRPAYGAALGNPGRVTGSADVFEATFRVAVLDGAGKVLADEQVMATCGSGCRGTFDAIGRLRRRQGPVGHPSRLRPIREGRVPDGRPRLPGLADARQLKLAVSSAGSVKRAPSVGAWRSLVARIVRDDEVGGSNPLARPYPPDLVERFALAMLAPMIEADVAERSAASGTGT